MKNLMMLLLLAVCACVDSGGPTALEDFLDDLAVAAEVASITECSSAMSVGEVALCAVDNAVSTGVEVGGVPFAIWESSAPTIVKVTLDGEVTALSVGSATITVRGPNNSSATLLITVS